VLYLTRRNCVAMAMTVAGERVKILLLMTTPALEDWV